MVQNLITFGRESRDETLVFAAFSRSLQCAGGVYINEPAALADGFRDPATVRALFGR